MFTEALFIYYYHISFPKQLRRCTADDKVHCVVLWDVTAPEDSETLNLPTPPRAHKNNCNVYHVVQSQTIGHFGYAVSINYHNEHMLNYWASCCWIYFANFVFFLFCGKWLSSWMLLTSISFFNGFSHLLVTTSLQVEFEVLSSVKIKTIILACVAVDWRMCRRRRRKRSYFLNWNNNLEVNTYSAL